jgi:hypothetical protein
VSQQFPVEGCGVLLVLFAAHFLMLLPTSELMASVALGVMPLWMKQPHNTYFQGTLHELDQCVNHCIHFLLSSSNAWSSVKRMHNIFFFVIFVAS